MDTRTIASLRDAMHGCEVVPQDELGARDPGWDASNLKGLALVRPRSTEDVRRLVLWCRDHGRVLVPQGGRTGLVGGSVTEGNEIICDLGAMNAIEEIDARSGVAIVQTGATLHALQAATAAVNLHPGIDLASRGSATVGGLISTNAGGMAAFRAGVMRHRVLGLEVVLPDGRVFDDLTRVMKTSAGYDLKQLFIGAEGTLGIVTRAAIRLEPLPQGRATALVGLGSADEALTLLRHLTSRGTLTLLTAEIMWRRYFEATAGVLGITGAQAPLDRPCLLALEIAGESYESAQDALETALGTLLESGETFAAVVARSNAQAERLWRLREDTEILFGLHPHAPSFDVSLPSRDLDAYVARLEAGLRALDPAFAPYVFGHLADGNLHIVLNAEGPFSPERQTALERVVYAELRVLGGSFSAEHGIGSKRVTALRDYGDPVKVALMADLKKLLDPAGLCNPGKVVRPS